MSAPNQDRTIHLLRGGYYTLDMFHTFSSRVRHKVDTADVEKVDINMAATTVRYILSMDTTVDTLQYDDVPLNITHLIQGYWL